VKLFRRTLSADCSTPVQVFSGLRAQQEACFLFESAEGGEHWGRYSIIGFDPAAIAVEHDDALHIRQRDGSEQRMAMDMQAWLRQEVIAQAIPEGGEDLPFSGGAVGYFAYDMVYHFEEGLKAPAVDGNTAAYMLIDRFVILDSLHGVMHICVLEDEQAHANPLLDSIEHAITHAPALPAMRLDVDTNIQPPTPHMAQADYEAMVRQAKSYILAGDIFQVVLSQRFSAPLQCDPLAIYRAVRHINPSPYLFYMHVGDTTLIGSSPEALVKKNGKKAIVRPIAGTRPRGRTHAEDVALEHELLADDKEIAEHVMLMDLGRNDLGRVCDYGSVKVSESMIVERYSHVMHIVSEVQGSLRDDVDALDLLAATFPAGTLSGAPKIRAMQIIHEQEPEPRGPYGGCIGHISYGGHDMDTAIIIRTAVIQDDTLYVQAGAGIVADSVPELEHQECVNKASAMFRSVALAQSQSRKGTPS